jgi:hypothetical protein
MTSTTPAMLKMGDTNTLSKEDSLTDQGHQCIMHASMTTYLVCQHAILTMAVFVVMTCLCLKLSNIMWISVDWVAIWIVNYCRFPDFSSTNKGDVNAVYHQAEFLGKGESILSCLQMEH